jgi:hypothetical protein
MTSFSANSLQYLHLGSATKLGQYITNSAGNLSAFNNRTPAALVNSSDNLWQFDHFYDSVAAVTRLIAHAAPNLSAIDSTLNRAIWFGTDTAAAVLTDTTLAQVSGGIVVLGPYLFSFGNDGNINYSAVNNPTAAGASAFITQQKIVKGMVLRGNGSGPAGLFWSLDSLIRASFVGGVTVWNFDTITSESSILSSQGVIEYDGIYFWAGVDRFLMFNGVVREIPNTYNNNWFFDGLNINYRQKVFAFKVPRWGEIWWCYPRGNATECTHAVIYNVREGSWYDTELPDGGRTCGIYAKVFEHPFMTGLVANATPAYTLWLHESGTDRIEASSVNPIQSFFSTNEISMITQEESIDKSLRVARIEPDFVQVGDMTVTVVGRQNSRAPFVDGPTFTFGDTAPLPEDQTIKLKEIARLMTFKFESNTVGGNYEMGESLAHIEPADGRIQS